MVIRGFCLLCPPNEPQNNEQNNGTYCGAGNRADKPNAEMNSQPGQQPTTDKCPNDSHNYIAKQTEPAAFDDDAGQYSCYRPNHEPNNQRFDGHPCFSAFSLNA
jgi:hypothetical protein